MKLDLDAIEARAKVGIVGSAVAAGWIHVLREDVPALVARVRELEEALEEALRPDPVWDQLDALAHKMLDLHKEFEAKACPAPRKGDSDG